MREISLRNQKVIDEAKSYGLDLSYLRQVYNLKFAIRLFKYLKRKSGNKTIFPIYSQKYYSQKKSVHDYMGELEDSGFKLKKEIEPFIDEDTGKIVNIQRFYLKPLRIKKNKK